MVQGGEALTRKLVEQGWPVVLAFWSFERDENQWKLIFASPNVNVDGPKKAYEAIQKALLAITEHFTDLQYITVVAPDHPLVKTLAAVLPTDSETKGVRVSRNMINGRYIDDAYLYRIDEKSAAA